MTNQLSTGRMIQDLSEHTLIERIAAAVDEYQARAQQFPNFAYVHPDNCAQPCDIYLNEHKIHIEPNPYVAKHITWIGMGKEN